MDSIFVWNCRGAGNNSFVFAIKHYMQVYNPQLVAILEPRVSGRVGSEVRKKLGFKFSKVVEARGFGGGIWILWNDPNLNFTALSSSTQFTHFRVQNDLEESCLTTVVYAAPNLMGRQVLWQDLKRLSNSISELWLLVGDFNAMIDRSEKSGGVRFNHVQAREFRNCIHDCSLFDTGFTGAKFTWFRGRLKERIDRALCNEHWLRAFQDAQTYHVERIKSDHQPLPGFQDCCLSWNKDVFGHIFKRKRTLGKRLRLLEHMSHSDRDGQLTKEEDSVRMELEKNVVARKDVLVTEVKAPMVKGRG